MYLPATTHRLWRKLFDDKGYISIGGVELLGQCGGEFEITVFSREKPSLNIRSLEELQ